MILSSTFSKLEINQNLALGTSRVPYCKCT